MSNIFYLGLGGCGNKMVESMAKITDRRIGLNNMYEYNFLNSNKIELFKNSHANSFNSIQLSAQNGAGQDKELAKKILSSEKSKILNFLNSKIDYIDRLVLISSMSGGTGSTSLPIISKLAKKIKPSLDINVITVSPDIYGTSIELENALLTYEDIINLNNNKIIESTVIIDNSKMDINETDFNKKCMELILDSYEVGNDNLDSTDLQKVSSAKDYKTIIYMEETLGNIGTDIRFALDNSPFVLNTALSSEIRTIQCTHMGGVLSNYTKNDLKSEINATMFNKIEKGNKNFIVLSGLKMPNEHFNNMQNILLTKKEEINENVEAEFKLNRPTIRKAETREDTITEKEKLLSLLDDDDIF